MAAVSDLFDGQLQGPPECSVNNLGAAEGLFAGQKSTARGVGSRLLLAEEPLRENLPGIQLRNDIEVDDPSADPDAR